MINHLFVKLVMIGFLCIGCADEGSELTPFEPIKEYPIYTGELIVENQSQFEFTALYFHRTPRLSRMESSNLLITPFLPGESIIVNVAQDQYITAFRPRVEQGPLWKIQSEQAVSFYKEEDDMPPRLWILDQGFMVIDSASKDRD